MFKSIIRKEPSNYHDKKLTNVKNPHIVLAMYGFWVFDQ